MIALGFTIDKVLEAVEDLGQTRLLGHLRGAFNFGVALISLGLVALTIACIQHWRLQKQLVPDPGRRPFPLSIAVGGLMVLFGAAALIDVLWQVGPF